MGRTTKAELDQLTQIINSNVGADGVVYSLENSYGQNRLVRNGGSVSVSPRLPAGQLAEWMRAFLAGSSAMEACIKQMEEREPSEQFGMEGPWKTSWRRLT